MAMKNFDHLVNLLHIVTPHSDKLGRGESVTIKCPDCGSDMTISRSKDNGHLRVVCTECSVKISQ